MPRHNTLVLDEMLCSKPTNGTVARHGERERGPVVLEVSPVPSSPLDEKASQSQDQAKPKSKLGKIGGKKKVDITGVISSLKAGNTPNDFGVSRDTAFVVKTQEGDPETLLGMKANQRGNMEVPGEGSPPPRETSQERANRNREKLKRELDIQSHTGTKKKRRF